VAAGTTATLDVNGGSFLQVALPTGAMLSPLGNAALVSGSQAVSAVRNIVNLPASVNAQNASGSSGNIYLGGTISVDSASGDAGHIKVLGNTTTVAGTLSAQATGATGNGGKYAITGSGLTAESDPNYTISFAQASGNATALSITPRPLSLIANPISQTHGSAIPTTDGASATGGTALVNGDTVSKTSVTTPATKTSVAGSYVLTAANAVFSKGLATNYTITYVTSPTGLTLH